MIKLISDLNSVAFRHFYKQGKDADEARGTFIGAFHTTCDAYDVSPKDCVFAYDPPDSRQGRQAIYPPYKTHRKQDLTPDEQEELRAFMDVIKEDLMEAGAITVTHPKVEGDDIVLYLAEKFPEAYIWGGDKDLFQAGNPIIHLDELKEPDDNPFGIPYWAIPLYHAIVGDPKDYGSDICKNGIGPSFMKKLYEVFGDYGLKELMKLIENRELKKLEEDLDDMPELAKLIKDERNVYLRWQLAKPLPVKDYLLKWQARMNLPKLVLTPQIDEWKVDKSNFLEALDEFRTERDKGHPVVFDLETYHVPEALEWLKQINQNIKRSKRDYMWVDPLGSVITGLGIKCGQFAGYFSFNHKDTDNCTDQDLTLLIQEIAKGKKLVAHNAIGFELPVIYRNTGIWLPPVYDTMLMASYVDENNNKGLKGLTEKWLNYKQTSYADVTQGRQMNELTLDEVFQYGIDDVYTTEALYNLFKKIMAVEGTWDAFQKVEVKATLATAKAYERGVNFDPEELEKIKAEDKAAAEQAMNEIKRFLVERQIPGFQDELMAGLSVGEIKRAYQIFTGKPAKFRVRLLPKIIEAIKDDVPVEFIEALEREDLDAANAVLAEYCQVKGLDVKSNKVMCKLLYEDLGYPVRFRGDVTDLMRRQGRTKGNPKADDVALRHAMAYDARDEEEKKLLQNIIRVREYLTRNSLYYTPYPYLRHWSDGRIHSSLGQSKTTSRRFAPQNPNVNQLPKKGEGKKVRNCLSATPGFTMVSADFSGQELRAAAFFSQDPTLLAAFVGDQKIDLHSAAGLKVDRLLDDVFKGDYDAFIKGKEEDHPEAKKLRALGKGMNFSLQYFGTAMTLIKNLVVEEDLAEKMVKAYYDTYPEFIKWREGEAKKIRQRRYSLTKLGARRHLHKYFYGGEISDHWIRSGVNFIIQSSSAEQTKIVWGNLVEVCEKYGAYLLFPVHDQVVCEVPNENLEAFLPEFLAVMEAPFWYEEGKTGIPSESDCEIGDRFGSLKPIERKK